MQDLYSILSPVKETPHAFASLALITSPQSFSFAGLELIAPVTRTL